MRLTYAVANAAALVLSLSAFTLAMPGPWSVPQGTNPQKAKTLYGAHTDKLPEHFEVLTLRHAIPFNADSVTDVKCANTEA